MSSLEHTQKSDQENEPMDYEVEYQKQKEEIALLKQSLERERKRIAELTAFNSSLILPGMYFDVTLLVEGKKMAVHQHILSTHSPVLAALMERGQNEDGVLVITGTKVDTFEMLLRFIYTGQVPLLKRPAATELMAAAEKYNLVQLEGLKKCLLGQLVTHLPDLCLAALFRQMTLEDQIDARKVCRRWADLVLETASKRRELILLLCDKSIEEFEKEIDYALFDYADGTAMYPTLSLTSWNSLHLDSLDQASAEEIASTFIGAKKLQVTALNDLLSMADNLAHLLELWSRQLVNLQLIKGYSSTEYFGSSPLDHGHRQRLFSAINAQSALKKLHLHLPTLPVQDLSIVSQLEELCFFSHITSPQQFVQILQQYGEANQSLALIDYEGETIDDDSDVQDLFSVLSEHLRRCFTRFDCTVICDPARICAQFSGLTTLRLNPSRITPRHLFAQLANLHQLIHLILSIDSNSFSVDNLEHHLMLPQVKTVKALELDLWDEVPLHQELAKLKLSWTLPNVEVIHFLFASYCTECNIDDSQKRSEQAKSCLRKLFAPLKRDCTKLRLIKHDGESVYGTAEELLAD